MYVEPNALECSIPVPHGLDELAWDQSRTVIVRGPVSRLVLMPATKNPDGFGILIAPDEASDLEIQATFMKGV